MNVTNHKCPTCGAGLPFDPKKGLWVCKYCNTTFTEQDLAKEQEEPTNEEVKQEETGNNEQSNMDLYKCPSCGAQIIADENTTATFCVYCKNPAIIKSKLKGKFEPQYILPFKTTKQDAMDAFIKFKNGKIFTPEDFENPKNVQEITGIYIPFWLYSCDVDATIRVRGEKIKSWRMGNYRYTKTDTYSVIREGNIDYDDIPADGSEKFADDIMDSIEPYGYTDLTEFNLSYLSGFLAENYDVSNEDAFSRAKLRIENTSKDELNKTVTGYTTKFVESTDININNMEHKYVLLPVWLLNTKYKEKIYTFAMNGQTGKMVGNIPICKKKLIKKTLLTLLVSLIVTTIIVIIYRGIGG